MNRGRRTRTTAHTGGRWMLQAACAQIGDPELWFPSTGASTREARDVCGRCPVAAECELEWQSLPADMQRHGIWAGVSAHERIQSGQIRTACPRCGIRLQGQRRYCSTVCADAARRERQRRYEAGRT